MKKVNRESHLKSELTPEQIKKECAKWKIPSDVVDNILEVKILAENTILWVYPLDKSAKQTDNVTIEHLFDIIEYNVTNRPWRDLYLNGKAIKVYSSEEAKRVEDIIQKTWKYTPSKDSTPPYTEMADFRYEKAH